MSFGRHQSFYLKEHWINKGLKAIDSDNTSVFEVKKYKKLGIGKNMHQSLRFWLEACNIATPSTENKKHDLTPFGEILLEKDPSCVKNQSLLLLNFFLCSNTETDKVNFGQDASGFHWFFSRYTEDVFTKEKLKVDISNDNLSISKNTLSKEVDTIIATYTNESKAHPEDKNISLLAKLGLVSKQGELYTKSPLRKEYYDLKTFLYFFLVLQEANVEMTINSVLESRNSFCRFFNFNRTSLINLIDEMTSKKVPIELTRTNNLDTINIKTSISSKKYLLELY
jgi:hypothetical protein